MEIEVKLVKPHLQIEGQHHVQYLVRWKGGVLYTANLKGVSADWKANIH